MCRLSLSDIHINIPFNGFLGLFEVNGVDLLARAPVNTQLLCVHCWQLFSSYFIFWARHIKLIQKNWLNVNCRIFLEYVHGSHRIAAPQNLLHKPPIKATGCAYNICWFVCACMCGKSLKFVFHHSIYKYAGYVMVYHAL